MSRILIVDDERNMRKILASNLVQDKHIVTEAACLAEATACLSANRYDAVITDQKMADGQGMDVLSRAREMDVLPWPLFFSHRFRARDLFELCGRKYAKRRIRFHNAKPFQPEVVRATIPRRACEHTELLRENDLLKLTVDRLEGSREIFGSSPATLALRLMIARVAPTNATVLITGETGTGKEVVARSHTQEQSASAEAPLSRSTARRSYRNSSGERAIRAIEKGAFTGADRIRQGLFEAAHEGTLFLDEAGEMSPATQAKLLRVLAEGKILRVGSTKPRDVDVRVLVATHRDLEERTRQGTFRQDLYYRLAVVPIALAPLRKRPEDIPGFCELFCREVSRELKVPIRPISAAAVEKLKRYGFPGNIRELRNLIERAMILSVGAERSIRTTFR